MSWAESGVPLEQRLWSRVTKTGTCWLWTGHVTGGYGRIRTPEGRVQVHRLTYEWEFEPIPEGMQLDHLCRNQLCVRPTHLEPVSPQVNTSRGIAPSTLASKNNRCVRDLHNLTPDNTRVRSNGKRECRTCARQTRTAYREANRELINSQKRAAYARKTEAGG